MEVDIDPEVIARAVGEVVQKGITDGVGNWQTKDAIDKAVMTAVLEADLPKLLHDQLQAVLTEQATPIVNSLAQEMIPWLKIAFSKSLKASMVAMLAGLQRGKPSYMGEAELKQWRDIEESLSRASEETITLGLGN